MGARRERRDVPGCTRLSCSSSPSLLASPALWLTVCKCRNLLTSGKCVPALRKDLPYSVRRQVLPYSVWKTVAPLNHLLLPRRNGPALPPGQSLRPPPNQLPVGQPDQCPAERDWQPDLPVAASRSATLDGHLVLPRDEEHLPQCPHPHAFSPAFTPQVPCWLDIPFQHLHPSQSLVLRLTVAEGM